MAANNGGISVDTKQDLATLLSHGETNEDVLKLYATKGLLDIPDNDGRTALMVACLRGFKDVVEFLLDNGANPNLQSVKEANRLLHYVCMEGNESPCLKCSSRRMKHKVSLLKLLLRHKTCQACLQSCLDITNKDGQTPLMCACMADLDKVVKFLLANGASLNLRSSEGNTHMHYACMEDPKSLYNVYNGYSKQRKARKVSIVKHLLNHKAHCLDVSNKDGQTPLMFACLGGFEDVVKLLLENGANPNSKNLTEAATPLHYACTVMTREDKLGNILESSCKRCYSKRSRIPIVELLLSYGAIAVENSHVWSPTCVAAFYLQKDIVDDVLAMDEDNIPVEEEIKVAEILAVSSALLMDITCREIYHLFSRAIFLQQFARHATAQPATSELRNCFAMYSWKECRTQVELESIKESRFSMEAHAILIGERLYPQTLKQRYLYPWLLDFADRFYHSEMWDEFYHVMSFALGLERRSQLKLGSVAANFDSHCFDFQYDETNDTFLQHMRTLLLEYESVFQHVHIDSLSAHVDSTLKSLGTVLFSDAFYCSTGDGLLTTLQAIEKSIRSIRGRIRRGNPGKFREMYSVVYELMYHLFQAFDYFNMFRLMGEDIAYDSLTNIRFVVLKILSSESTCNTDREEGEHVRGDTLLHLVARCARFAEGSVLQDSEYLVDIARAFIRHGCPIDAVNARGETASDVLLESGRDDQDAIILSLLRPTTVPKLEELAIRSILRHDLIYQEALPRCLCEMIESDHKTLTL